MSSFQIRIRTDAPFSDILYVQQWLQECGQGFAFEHDKPGNHHYHIYLFGLLRNADAMRRHIGKYLPDKVDYSVKTTAGGSKNLPLKDDIAYQYGTTEKLLKPVWSKGYDNDRLEKFSFYAEAFYRQMEERQQKQKQVVHEILVLNQEKVKPDRVWENLMIELIENRTKYDDKTIPEIKSMIATSYLRKLKAMPRPSDLHRYATSLWYIVKYQLHVSDNEIPELAMVQEFAN